MAELWFNQKLEHKEGKCVVYLWFNHDFNAGLVRFNGNVMGRYWKIPILVVV